MSQFDDADAFGDQRIEPGFKRPGIGLIGCGIGRIGFDKRL